MVKERFDSNAPVKYDEVIFNAEPFDFSGDGAPAEYGHARLIFDKKGRCIKDNHTNIIGRQQLVDGLLDSAREMLQKSRYIGEGPSSATVEGLIDQINEALAP